MVPTSPVPLCSGGLIADIRALQADTIRAYHAAYYRPDNLSIAICGKVDQAELFAALEPIEATIVSKGPLPPLQRPWSSPVPPFSSPVEVRLQYPSEDEEQGRLSIGWRCTEWRDFYSRTALDCLWTYLCTTSLSPLHREMIEIEHPYAGEVDSMVLEKSVGIHLLEFSDVDVGRIDEVKDKLMSVVRGLVERRELDMERMRSIIRKEIRQTKAGWEEQPHEAIVGYVVSNFLYGERSELKEERKEEGGRGAGKDDTRGDLEREMRVSERLLSLLEEDQAFWLGLIQRWILDPPYALIVGLPSHAESARLMAEEESRIAAQVAALRAKDPDALVHLEAALQKAIAHNSAPAPDDLLASFPAPDLTRVPQHRVYTLRTGHVHPALSAQNGAHPHAAELDVFVAQQPPLSSLPIVAQFDHIPSEFVQVRALLSTDGLSDEEKQLLPLFREVMFESPVQRRDGRLLSSEQVVTALEDQLVHYESACGTSSGRFGVGSYGQHLHVALKVEAAEYSTGLRWLFDLLHGLQFTAERLSVALKKMLASIPEMKSDGQAVLKAASAHVNFSDHSMQHAVNFLRQQALLRRILKALKSSDPAHGRQWIERLKAVQQRLTRREALVLHVACDFLKQSRLVAAVVDEAARAEAETATPSGGPLSPGGKRGRLQFSSAFLRPLADGDVGAAELTLLGVKACRSSYLSTTVPLPPSFSPSHPVLPALRLTLEYLTTLEGPMWRRIRGLGYSYSYSIRIDTETGLLSFALFKSTNVCGGYQESEAIVREFERGGSAVWKEGDIRAAKSSLGFELLSAGDTMAAAADQSLYTWIKGEAPGYQQRMLEAVQRVQAPEMEAAMSEWVSPLFDGRRSRVCLVTNPSHLEDVTAFFAKDAGGGRKVTAITHLQRWFEGQGKEQAEEDEGDEEDEEEEDDEDDDDGEDEDGDDDDEDDD